MSESGETLGAIRYGLRLQELKRIEALLPVLSAIAPTRVHQSEICHFENRIEGRVVGVTPEYELVHGTRLESGRFIEELDCSRNMPVAVLGAELARTLIPISDPLGRSIRIGEDRYFRVVGVLRPRASTPGLKGGEPAEDYGRDVYIPFPTDLKLFGENVAFDRSSSFAEKVDITQLTLSMPSPEHVKPAARIVEAIVQDAGKEDEATITVPLDLLEKAEQTQRIFTWVLTAIASISLLVGGIGIMNIMLATVTERTREVGIRRALGARRADIVTQFLIETTVLSCTGGLIGIALGVTGAVLAEQLAGVVTQVRPWAPLLAFGISVAVGLIFGIYPARRAAYMDPVEALRHE
jgi:putative ABC transport system permease protein